MKSKEQISNSKGNWYIAELIEKCELIDRNERQDLRRVNTYGNYHLIKATSPEKAFDKAEKLGRQGEYKYLNANKKEAEWIFVGIANLLPIYDESIKDGAELMWHDYGFISNRRTERLPISKEEFLENIQPKKIHE